MTQDCLFASVLFKNYVHLIMLGLDEVIIWGNHFRHISHQAAIIILVILYFACVCILILYYNHVYNVFTAVLVHWDEIWAKNDWGNVSNYLFHIIIYYFKLNHLVLSFFPYQT